MLDLQITELGSPEYAQTLNRAEKRIKEAILDAQVNERFHNEEIEILSFPIAIVMVSSTKDLPLKRRYALSESKRAYKLLKLENSLSKIIKLAGTFNWRIEQTDSTSKLALHFTDFLRNTTGLHESKWKLINRTMFNGMVQLTRNEAARLLSEEVRQYIEKKLETKIEFTLPQNVTDRVDRLKKLFRARRGKMRLEEMPKEVVTDAFPPCIRQLRAAAIAGRHISHIGRFTLTSFLINSGMTINNVVNTFRPASDFKERLTRYQVEHIAGGRGSRTKYVPPRCDTLRTHGVCPGMDEICRKIRHPLSYYRRKLREVSTETPRLAAQ